jgi:CRISPR-associated protein Csc1
MSKFRSVGLVDSHVYSITVAEEDLYRYLYPEHVSKYNQHLTPLNHEEIYINPARSLNHSAILNTWKYANNNYHVEMEKTQKNITSFGRSKEIAPESKLEFFLIAREGIKLPKWISLGKWISKAEIKVKKLLQPKTKTDLFTSTNP